MNILSDKKKAYMILFYCFKIVSTDNILLDTVLKTDNTSLGTVLKIISYLIFYCLGAEIY